MHNDVLNPYREVEQGKGDYECKQLGQGHLIQQAKLALLQYNCYPHKANRKNKAR
jgi:hypothetical protein